MSLHSRFFGGPEGDIPEYNQTQFAEVFKRILSDGVFSGVDNEFEVTETDPVSLGVKVNTGWAFIQGFWAYNDDALIKTLGAADPSLDRIDRIVLRLDTNTNFQISVEVLEGTPSADPSAPALTQTDSIYEIELAQVEVGATVTSINNANITDGRDYVEANNILPAIMAITDLTGYGFFLDEDDMSSNDDTKVPSQQSVKAYADSIDEKADENTTVVTSTASNTTPTPVRASTRTVLKLTAQANDAEFQNPTGTPKDMDLLWIIVTAWSSDRSLTYGDKYVTKCADNLPDTATVGKELNMLFKYDEDNDVWGMISISEEA